MQLGAMLCVEGVKGNGNESVAFGFGWDYTFHTFLTLLPAQDSFDGLSRLATQLVLKNALDPLPGY